MRAKVLNLNLEMLMMRIKKKNEKIMRKVYKHLLEKFEMRQAD